MFSKDGAFIESVFFFFAVTVTTDNWRVSCRHLFVDINCVAKMLQHVNA